MPKLEIIDCSHNKISDISEIKSLNNLKTVCFGFNLIENIEPLKNCIKIKELDLQRNRIFSVPVGTFKFLTNLQRLNISFNYLLEIPSELTILESLKEINISNNKISEIKKGKWICMRTLEVFNLSSNCLEDLNSITGVLEIK